MIIFSRYIKSIVVLLLFSRLCLAETSYEMEAITVIGNKESPNQLYIVPWEPIVIRDEVDLKLSSDFFEEAVLPINRGVMRRKINAKKSDK